ncbi:MAG: RDD family protein [Fibrobacter sp.]|nr:RDD family protein [Fibrobacter sp.]
MIWYYIDESITDGDRRKGPYSIDELMDLVKSETVKPQTLVWHSGMKDWVRWEDTEEAKNNANLFEKGESAEGSALSDEEQIKAALEAILAEHKASKRYAGFFVRAAAYFVDNLILSAFGIVILMVLSAMQLADLNAISEAMNAYIADPSAEDAMSKILEAPGTHLFLSIWGIVQGIYFIVFTAIKSATPGKKLFKIHVEPAYSISTVSGIAKVSWVLSTLRYVASLFTQFTLMFYGIGYLVVMIDPKRRSLHDWIARTYVVHDTSVKIKVRPDDDQEK